MRLRVVPLAFVLTVLVEIVVFVLVGHAIGYGLAVLLVLGLSLVGGFVLKHEGVLAWTRFQSVVSAGERPGAQLTRSLVGLLGAVLLVIPGFVSAAVGVLLFVPPIRSLAGRGLTGVAGRRLSSSAMGDLFGPRMVRVKVGKPTSPGSSTAGGAPASSAPVEIVEGEIIDPQ
jgi:UPF0716 protein FxsA